MDQPGQFNGKIGKNYFRISISLNVVRRILQSRNDSENIILMYKRCKFRKWKSGVLRFKKQKWFCTVIFQKRLAKYFNTIIEKFLLRFPTLRSKFIAPVQ